MGITLHYKGKLKSYALIDEMKQEVIDIAEGKDWTYTIVDPQDHFYLENKEEDNDQEGGLEIEEPLPLAGVMLGPKGAEPLYLTFLPDGRLISPLLAVFGRKDIEEFLALDEYYAFTKTQDAGLEVHVEYVQLLKYLSSKYFVDWSCKDESGYYETGDKKKLQETMDMIDNTMSALEEAFSEHGHNLDHANPDEVKDFISSVLGVDDLEVKMIGAIIDEDGIEIIDEDSYLQELLSDENDDEKAPNVSDKEKKDIEESTEEPTDQEAEDDIDLNDLLDLNDLD